MVSALSPHLIDLIMSQCQKELNLVEKLINIPRLPIFNAQSTV